MQALPPTLDNAEGPLALEFLTESPGGSLETASQSSLSPCTVLPFSPPFLCVGPTCPPPNLHHANHSLRVSLSTLFVPGKQTPLLTAPAIRLLSFFFFFFKWENTLRTYVDKLFMLSRISPLKNKPNILFCQYNSFMKQKNVPNSKIYIFSDNLGSIHHDNRFLRGQHLSNILISYGLLF